MPIVAVGGTVGLKGFSSCEGVHSISSTSSAGGDGGLQGCGGDDGGAKLVVWESGGARPRVAGAGGIARGFFSGRDAGRSVSMRNDSRGS